MSKKISFKINSKLILDSRNKNLHPKVNVGVPTYKRETLSRALESLSNQKFRNFNVLISDNSGFNKKTIDIVEKYKERLPGVCLYAQEKNLGSVGNCNFLLSLSDTEYFMWLADDDEISANYLSLLVKSLEENPEAISAMGKCIIKRTPDKNSILSPANLLSNNRNSRIFNFIFPGIDDSFFYALHRTKYLKKCSFDGYFYPNNGIVTNFCFVYLFDLVLLGPILYIKNANLSMHAYLDKHYLKGEAYTAFDKVKTLIRRINVYIYYVIKTYRSNPTYLPFVITCSIFGLFSDIVRAFIRRIKYLIVK